MRGGRKTFARGHGCLQTPILNLYIQKCCQNRMSETTSKGAKYECGKCINYKHTDLLVVWQKVPSILPDSPTASASPNNSTQINPTQINSHQTNSNKPSSNQQSTQINPSQLDSNKITPTNLTQNQHKSFQQNSKQLNRKSTQLKLDSTQIK